MRVLDRLLSVLLALVLLVGGLALAAEVVTALSGRTGYLLVPWPALAAWGRAHRWDDGLVIAAGAGLTVVGLALLIAELGRRRPDLLVLVPRAEGVTTAVSRRSLARALAARADEVDGVRRASARLGRRRADVVAETPLRDPGDLRERVDAATTGWVDRLGLVATPTVRVRVSRRNPS